MVYVGADKFSVNLYKIFFSSSKQDHSFYVPDPSNYPMVYRPGLCFFVSGILALKTVDWIIEWSKFPLCYPNQ